MTATWPGPAVCAAPNVAVHVGDPLPRRTARVYDRDEARLIVEAAFEGRPGLLLLDAPPEPGRLHSLELRAPDGGRPVALSARLDGARVGKLWVARFARPSAASRERLLGALAAPDPLLGRRIARGRYQLLARIGEGGGGLVYRAWDTVGHRPVALKLCDPEAARIPALRRQFRIEGFVASIVDHPHLVRAFDFGVDQGTDFIALELVTGPTLQSLLDKTGAWSAARALGMIAQVASGLGELHALGVVHRDVKPANVLLARGERGRRAVLCDYGTALLLERGAGDDPIETRPRGNVVLWGTPEYMAPEQVAGDVIDPRADVFACGVLLYRMLAGRLPWEGTDPLSVARQRLFVRPQRLREHGAKIGAALEDVVLAALSPTPAGRPKDGTELLDALLRAVGHRRSPAPPAVPPASRAA